jgi:pyruvate/2-oxoglutarate dehydrogenase complex dihydrolipoamide acyltransferase (E2) component
VTVIAAGRVAETVIAAGRVAETETVIAAGRVAETETVIAAGRVAETETVIAAETAAETVIAAETAADRVTAPRASRLCRQRSKSESQVCCERWQRRRRSSWQPKRVRKLQRSCAFKLRLTRRRRVHETTRVRRQMRAQWTTHAR